MMSQKAYKWYKITFSPKTRVGLWYLSSMLLSIWYKHTSYLAAYNTYRKTPINSYFHASPIIWIPWATEKPISLWISAQTADSVRFILLVQSVKNKLQMSSLENKGCVVLGLTAGCRKDDFQRNVSMHVLFIPVKTVDLYRFKLVSDDIIRAFNCPPSDAYIK